MPTPTLSQQVQQGISPFLQGSPGASPLTQAAMANFQSNVSPVIQNSMTLQGLGQSPAVGQALGQSLAAALPQFTQMDFANRFNAANALQGEEQLNQNAARLSADISNQEAMRQLQGASLGGNLLLGASSNILAPASQLQQQQQMNALQGFSGAGQLQQGLTQARGDAAQQERLRQQSLAESGTTGIFGGFPSTLSSQTQSSGK